MTIEAGENGIPLDQYWFALSEGVPITLAAFAKQSNLRYTEAFWDPIGTPKRWIILETDGFPARHMRFEANVTAFATRAEAIAQSVRWLQSEREGVVVRYADKLRRIDEELEVLKRAAHVRGEDDCCEYEDRDNNGSCRTCGDPPW